VGVVERADGDEPAVSLPGVLPVSHGNLGYGVLVIARQPPVAVRLDGIFARAFQMQREPGLIRKRCISTSARILPPNNQL
jgi:hypothetical protein